MTLYLVMGDGGSLHERSDWGEQGDGVIHNLYQLLAHRGLPTFIGGLCGDHSPHRTTMTQRKCCPILHFGLWWLHLPVSTRAASFTVTQTTFCATARVRDRSLGDQLAADNNDLSDISESKSSLIAHRTLVEFRPTPSPTGDELWEHFVGEFMMTFLLVFSGLETAVNSDFDHLSKACFAIGLTVFLG